MRSGERGAVAIIVAIILVVLCGFVALSLDVGHLLSVRGELQNGADAAALAGANRLNGTNKHFELAGARADATNYARNHSTDLFKVEPTTIQLGAWLPASRACSEVGGVQAGTAGADGGKFCAISGTTEEDAANINAVRVVTRREGEPGGTGGGAVELAFGAFVGKSAPQEVGAEAIAVLGGPCTQSCPDLPVAVRAGCLYDAGELRCDASGAGPIYFIGFSPAPHDSAGLTSLSDDVSASAKAACDILQRGETCSMPLGDDEPINIQNGQDVGANCDRGCRYKNGVPGSTKNDTVCEVIRRKADSDCDGRVDDADGDGRPDYTGQVPVVQYAGEDIDHCAAGDQYNQQAKVVGWATVGIVSVRCEAEKDLAFGAQPITSICDQYILSRPNPSSETTCIAIQLYCDEEDDEQSRVGCQSFGTSALQAALVR
jgi:hypothetical protein